MIQKKKKQIKLIILIAIIAMLITGGAIWFLNSNGLRNESLRNSQTDGKVDFSSKALVVVTDSDLENKYNATSFNKTYSGKYVLSFETEEATKKAYEELKKEDRIQEVYVDYNLKTQEDMVMSIAYEVLGQNVESWGTYAMGLNETQSKINSNTNKQNIVVAVIDTGFNLTDTTLIEKNLTSRIDSRYKSMTNNSTDITDNETMPHGTHVGGIILDGTPDNVKILPLKVATEDGKMSLEYVNSAIQYAIDNNVDVINMSLGNEFNNPNLPGIQETKTLINEAIEKNIIVIAAVGNGDEDGNRIDGKNIYPAAIENVIGVGALQTDLITLREGAIEVNSYIAAKQTQKSNLSYAAFSNYGENVDFSAPGKYILSLGGGEKGYLFLSGTSQAAPHVSAAVATLKSYNKDFTYSEILDALKYYTVDIGITGRDDDYGEGMVCFKNYQECTCNCADCDKIYCTGCLCADCNYHEQLAKVLTKIEITTNPTKTEYTEGEKFDKAGMVVTATYSDNSTETITDYTYTPTESLTTNDTTITIKYEDKTTTLNITVNPKTVEKTLSKIEITTNPTKMVYTEGESFDPAGMILTAVYSDDSREIVTSYNYEPAGTLTTNDTTITVKYQGKTATLNITVNAKTEPKTLDRIEVTTRPNKIKYKVGEKFDKTGMVVTAVYSDGSNEDITDYTYTPTGALKETDRTIEITYQGKTTNVNITVEPNIITKTLKGIEITINPTKTTYTVGETFDKTGMVVTAIYTDGTRSVITNYNCFPVTALTANHTRITVSYTEEGTTVTATIPIEVKTKNNNNNNNNNNSNNNGNITNGVVNNSTQIIQTNNTNNANNTNNTDNTTKDSNLAYTGAEMYILPIIIIAIIGGISFIKYRQYKEI